MDMSAEDPIAERRPAGEFFTDPGARVVWAVVRSLDEGQKHQLLDLLAGELAVGERSGYAVAGACSARGVGVA